MEFNLQKSAKEKILIVAHRGVSGGNIPCNTMSAYKIALMQGADMIEIDVTKGGDETLYIFHPGMEKEHLFYNNRIGSTDKDGIARLRYNNVDEVPTQFGLNTLDEIFEEFKGKCYINIDKFWDNPVEISKAIKRHGMQDQILVKSSLKPNVLDVLEEVAPEINFMPIVKREFPEHAELMKRNINYIGAEVLFFEDDNAVCQREFIDMMHRDGKTVWANAIIYDCKKQIAAGHSDDTALTEDMQKGWGWLADRGFDFIQTDWPLMLINYLKETNRLYK